MKLFTVLSILLLLNTLAFSQQSGYSIMPNFQGSCTSETDAKFVRDLGLLDDASKRLGSLTEFFLKIDYIVPSMNNTILNDDDDQNKFRLYISQSGHLCLEGKVYNGYGTGPIYTADAGAISIRQWHHIALKRLPGGDDPFYFKFDIYVDGSLRQNFVLYPAYVSANPSSWDIGDYNSAHGSFAGQIDEFRVSEFTDDCSVIVPTTPYSQNISYPALFHFDTADQLYEPDPPYYGGYILGLNMSADVYDPQVVPSTAPISSPGNCLKFGKSGFVVNSTLNAAIGANKIFSVEMWVYWSGFNGSKQTLWQYGGDDNAGFKVYINTSNELCALIAGPGGELSTRNGIPANTWTHVALVSNVGRSTVYINGTPVYGWFNSSFPIINPSNLKVLVGSNYNYSESFNGQVDEFRLIDGMTLYDGSSIYTIQKVPLNPVPGYAGILYHFDEGSGQTAINSSHPDMNGYYGLSTDADYLDPVFVGNNPLPVELSSFKAQATGNSVSLNWTTATEVNNYGFEIQSKNTANGILKAEWKTIGFVKGYGNSNSPHDYSFTDDKPSSGVLLYRLKQIDNDGQFKYYDPLSVTVDAPKEYRLMQNSPNPFNPATAIKFQLPENAFVTIKIFDQTGREITTLINEEKSAGSHVVYWNGKDSNGQSVSSGIYFYSLRAGTHIETRKMSLLK